MSILACSDDVLIQAATIYKEAVKKYVPVGKNGGTLRDSAIIVPYRGTYAVEYMAEGEPSKKGHPRRYAKAQFHGDNGSNRPESLWNRYTKGTGSYWTQRLKRDERKQYYDEVAKIVKEKLNGKTR